MYTASGINFGVGKVNFVDLTFPPNDINALGEVSYSQDLMGCKFDFSTMPPKCDGDVIKKGQSFKYGRFAANNIFIPIAKFDDPMQQPLTGFEKMIDNVLKIQWCPNEDHFKVSFNLIPGARYLGPYFLTYAGPASSAADAKSEL